jgi:predicted Zn-dependent protease with MMP-like domain
MTYEQFRDLVAEMVDEIPEQFLRELQGVHALEDERPEQDYEDVWRLGEYLDPGAEDFLGAGEGLGRHIALYYGSFAQIADLDPEFDWEEEIWETLTHELRHHVESLAGDATLIEEDLRQGQTFVRRDHEA